MNELNNIKTTFSNKKLLLEVILQFKIDIEDVHGFEHWQSVYRNCLNFANHMNIKSNVFEYFALLHDSKRLDDYDDYKHGYRAAKYTNELYKRGFIDLNKEDLNRLIFAISNHTITNKNAPLYKDPIVQICFDSDRFDIDRVGITPHPDYFATDIAKEMVLEKFYKF